MFFFFYCTIIIFIIFFTNNILSLRLHAASSLGLIYRTTIFLLTMCVASYLGCETDMKDLDRTKRDENLSVLSTTTDGKSPMSK